ncbi:MAG: hypothetical protein ACO1RT_18915 [Planctomycetaceae bacterium]
MDLLRGVVSSGAAIIAAVGQQETPILVRGGPNADLAFMAHSHTHHSIG